MEIIRYLIKILNDLWNYFSTGVDKATCRECPRNKPGLMGLTKGRSCMSNILEDIIKDKILTSGYFSVDPLATKPKGRYSIHSQSPVFE